jgi:hypothetical protein
MARKGKAGPTILLVLAHVLIGPFCVGIMFVAIHTALSGELELLKPIAGRTCGPACLLTKYIKLTPIFYVPGFLPALTTGLLTASQVLIKGRCTWLWAAICGAAASALLVGVPSLLFVKGAAQSWQIGYPATIAAMLAFQAVLGFFGTIPVWLATGRLRRRLAEARLAAAPRPAPAA